MLPVTLILSSFIGNETVEERGGKYWDSEVITHKKEGILTLAVFLMPFPIPFSRCHGVQG